MAFPRMNNISFWLLFSRVPAFPCSWKATGGTASRRWTLYAPLSTYSPGPAMDFAIFSLHIAGASILCHQLHHHHSTCGAGTPAQMPLFVWSILTVFPAAAVLPVLAGASPCFDGPPFRTSSSMRRAAAIDLPASVLVLGHRSLHPDHLFGMISHVSHLSKRPIFGYLGMAYAMVAIGFIGFWSGRTTCTRWFVVDTKAYFVFATMVIAVLPASRCFWIATWVAPSSPNPHAVGDRLRLPVPWAALPA